MTYCFFLCKRSDNLHQCNDLASDLRQCHQCDMAEWPPLMWRLIHVNLREKKKTAKTLLVNICKRKKLRAKAKWKKRNKKTTLQKQKQFASGQPHNGCNALDRNKKQKQKTTTPNLLDCSKPSKNKTNNKMIAQTDFKHGWCIVRLFQLYLPYLVSRRCWNPWWSLW